MRIWKLCFLAPTLLLAGCGDEDKSAPAIDRSSAAPVILEADAGTMGKVAEIAAPVLAVIDYRK